MDTNKLSNNVDFERWAQRFRERVTRDAFASRSWRRLTQIGFSEDLIALGFFLACDFPNSPGYEAFAEMRKESRRKAVRAKRLILRLEEDCKEICDLLGSQATSPQPEETRTPLDEYVTHTRLMDGIAAVFAGSPESDSGSAALETQDSLGDLPQNGSELQETELGSRGVSETATISVGTSPAAVAPTLQGQTALDETILQLRILEKGMRELASKRANGPSFFLALGLTLIKGTAGRPLYRDYAALINVANEIFGNDETPIGEEAVRKTFQRFMRRNPDAFKMDSASALILAAVLVMLYSIHPSSQSPRLQV